MHPRRPTESGHLINYYNYLMKHYKYLIHDEPIDLQYFAIVLHDSASIRLDGPGQACFLVISMMDRIEQTEMEAVE
jgi:hypothetical protein